MKDRPIEHPILFSTEMVKAIRDGRKTQTRRVIGLPRWMDPPNEDGDFEIDSIAIDGVELEWPYAISKKTGCLTAIPCPQGERGDILWVREAWRNDNGSTVYLADCLPTFAKMHKWRPSIFLPRTACRMTLDNVLVRVQRLQDISEEDARAEGVFPSIDIEPGDGWSLVMTEHGPVSYRKAYAALWDSINAKRGFSWDMNPYVWAITFKEHWRV